MMVEDTYADRPQLAALSVPPERNAVLLLPVVCKPTAVDCTRKSRALTMPSSTKTAAVMLAPVMVVSFSVSEEEEGVRDGGSEGLKEWGDVFSAPVGSFIGVV
jgi:hypothetical protein